MASTSKPTTTAFSLPSISKPTLSHNVLIWLVLLGVSVFLGVSLAIWLLLRFTCTRAGRREGQTVADGRNKHKEWWRHANPPVDDASDSSTLELANLTRHSAPVGESWPPTTSWPLPSRGLGVKSRYHAGGYLRDEPL